MSWLWGNETTEQAQFVVSALQSELDERENKIKALEAALRREQHDMTSLLEDEVKDLEARRKRIERELAGVDMLIKQKQALIAKNKSEKRKKQNNKSKTVASPKADAVRDKVSAHNHLKQNGHDTIQSRKVKTGNFDTNAMKETKYLFPMDESLKMVAKEEPNVAFIIQRSNNSNTVVYAGHKASDNGHPREELNMLERNTAYGVAFKPSDVPGEYMATIASLRDRNCVIRLDQHGNVLALTTINGKTNILLRRVFVQMTTSWGIPTVDYVEIFGVDPKTFEPVYEKKTNK
ncbi:uncharacterized protein PHALS_14263 [Plasmopara halstedii]|uniref:DUF4833 domain-containing protein n=1 Tax=Plasmopara halstedii TaxID=4781 RepID=A0A0P1AQZ6_PLAHL|nr:uncharacterized protein PHALS_14263 [Plasmopara halstedii]CEG43989.1 hypothetical protein PHALS_14263 [Plasmopara halstedii]|eukprot:XP_024580358.1 hypothetical protein PHALS_14263 [Plasmopara halstedii]